MGIQLKLSSTPTASLSPSLPPFPPLSHLLSLPPFPLSVNFNGHFTGGPGLADNRMSPFQILLQLRMMEVVVTTGAIRPAKL